MFILNVQEKIKYYFDKQYVSKDYFMHFGRKLNWNHPTRYSEKINILKISEKSELLTPYVDKYLVREFVQKSIGDKYLVPLLGEYRNSAHIPFDTLPNEFVLKTNHSSGTNIICKDKNGMNIKDTLNQLNYWMKKNYYNSTGRERQYKNIQRRILCEKYLDEGQSGLTDYKIYFFEGKPYFIRRMAGRYSDLSKSTHGINWELLPFTIYSEHEVDPRSIKKPKNLAKMVELASILAQPFNAVRVDFYNLNGQLYFGELTFTPAAGIQHFLPDKYDEFFGSKFML